MQVGEVSNMRKVLYPVAALSCLLGLNFAQAGGSGSIVVPVSGVQDDNGVVRCGLYNSADGFREPGEEFKGSVARISGGKATCVFNNVPAGTYAVAVFHAENNETTLETGMFGKPKEGYGFSRNAGGGFGPPSFSAASIDFNGNKATWPVRLHY